MYMSFNPQLLHIIILLMIGKDSVAVLGAGCFWCVEAVFQRVKGVNKVVSGYTGGHTSNPTYQQICTGQTGHAEVCHITFNPAVIPYKGKVRATQTC